MELDSSCMDIKNYLLVPLFCFITGCGGDSKVVEDDFVSTGIEPNAFGKVIDSKVIGLRYKSGEYRGITEENGEYGYILGEQVQFFVGDIAIGYEVEPKDILTPYELANNNSFEALNIARFLQSLDDDSILDNGIQIIESSHTLAKSKTIDFLSQEWSVPFDESSELGRLIYSLTSQTAFGSRPLISASDAYYHFSSTNIELMNDLQERIVNEIDVSNCTVSTDCKVFVVEPVRLDLCLLADKYVYSNLSTPVDIIEMLAEERLKLRDINSDLKAIANVNDNSTGFCSINEQSGLLSCNSEQQCEF